MAEQLDRLSDPYERAVSRLSGLVAFLDSADPLQVVSVPPLVIDMFATEYGLPPQRCVDDCLSLVHAYAQLGIAAQVHAVELSITDTHTGIRSAHGSLVPRWEDGLLHGHTVVWLPGLGHLVDVTAEQFAPIAELDQGPLILADSSLPGAAAYGAPERVESQRTNLLLTYTFTPPETTAALLDHPQVRADATQYRRRGLNVASASVALLAEVLSPQRADAIPHPRAAALVHAARDLPEHRTPSGDRRFVLTDPDGAESIARLDQIPLPEDTPPMIDLHRGGH
jgi:hypothetical protein